MKSNSNSHPIPVVLNTALLARVQRAARKMGISTSALIRFAIISHLPAVEAGRMVLTPVSK